MKGRLPHMTDIDFEILNQEKKKNKNWKVCWEVRPIAALPNSVQETMK